MAEGAVVRTFTGLAGLGLAVFALSACELAVHQVERFQRDCGRAWQAGCPVAVEIVSDRPIQSSTTVIDRDAILEHAETAPHRTCAVLPVGCQVAAFGDVVAESYVSAF